MITNKIQFDYEYLNTLEEVHEHIKNCESLHTQQVVFSTFHDALTQICFGCPKCNCHKTKGDIIDHKEVLICRDCGYVWPEK